MDKTPTLQAQRENLVIQGIWPALVTPLKENEELSPESLENLLEWHVTCGCHGFYVCGGTGEGILLKPEVRKGCLEAAVEICGRIKPIDPPPIVAHIGSADLHMARELATHAATHGAAAVSSIPPMYYTYDSDEIYDFYKDIADSVDIPVIIYASLQSNTNITSVLLSRLMEIPNIVGIKYTSYNLFEMRRMKDLNDGNVNVVNGPDENLLPALVMGADGGIGTTYNFMPSLYIRLYKAFKAGDMEIARESQFLVNKVIGIIMNYHILASTKTILSRMGIKVGHMSQPMCRLRPEQEEQLMAQLKELEQEIPDFRRIR